MGSSRANDDPTRNERQIPVTKHTLQLDTPWENEFGLVQAVRVRDVIYVGGQVSQDEKGKIIGRGNMEAQMRQAYINAAKVLQSFGATMNDVVKEEIFVTNMAEALPTASKVRRDVYPKLLTVASTMVQIHRLKHPDLLVEIKLTAKISLSGNLSGAPLRN